MIILVDKALYKTNSSYEINCLTVDLCRPYPLFGCSPLGVHWKWESRPQIRKRAKVQRHARRLRYEIKAQ